MDTQAASAAERERVLLLLRRHGWNTTSFQVLEPGFRYWWDGDSACVAYADTGSAWVAAGAPIAPIEEAVAVAERFALAARQHRRRARFFAIEGRFARLAHFKSMLVGEQAVWAPGEWDAGVRSNRSLREQLRRARSKGVQVRRLATDEVAGDSPVRQAVEGLIAEWLASRPMAAMGFLVDVHPFSFPQERRYFLAEAGGRVVGFLAAVPIYARGGWFLEDLLRSPAAPNGTAELLVDAAMRHLHAERSAHVTMGLAPLAGGVNGWLRAARDWTFGLYNFHGVHAFKAKFRPRAWEPVYLSYPEDEHGLLATYDSLAAFAGGNMPRFGLETLLRAPAPVLQVLAALLVPWTGALALLDPARWFPAPWVQRGWVAFDAALCAGLVWLSLRFRRWLATLLAVLITGDALLTLAEALAWNLPRARGALTWVVLCAAVLAPTTAALFLWHVRLLPGRLPDARSSPDQAPPASLRARRDSGTLCGMSDTKIILYQPPGRPFGMPNMSPFCAKLECYLRMAAIPYEARPANMMKAPKGKIPFVEIDGRLMGDSQLIIEHLERTRGAPLDAGLTQEQRAIGHAVRRMLEEGLYFVGIHLRWGRDDGFAILRPEFQKLLPPPLRLILPLIRRKVRKALHAQGTGRHTGEEMEAIGKADITALAAVLGDRPFLVGDRPSTHDASVYAFVESIGGFPLDSEVKRHLLAQANLVAYRDRIREKYWT